LTALLLAFSQTIAFYEDEGFSPAGRALGQQRQADSVELSRQADGEMERSHRFEAGLKPSACTSFGSHLTIGLNSTH
jgi:hypothetical protein